MKGLLNELKKAVSDISFISPAEISIVAAKDVVVFDYSEDFPETRNILKTDEIKKIATSLLLKDVCIYNSPLQMELYGYKTKIYDVILDRKLHIPIPAYKKINKKEDLEACPYPALIHPAQGSGGEFISVRLMVIDSTLCYFMARPSSIPIVHTMKQYTDETVLSAAHEKIDKWIGKNKDKVQLILDDLFSVLGPGFYGHDFVFYEDTLYLCEIGFKYDDYTYRKFLKKTTYCDESKCFMKKDPFKHLKIWSKKILSDSD